MTKPGEFVERSPDGKLIRILFHKHYTTAQEIKNDIFPATIEHEGVTCRIGRSIIDGDHIAEAGQLVPFGVDTSFLPVSQ